VLPGHALLVVGFGSPEEHQAMVAPIRKAVTPLFELVTPIPFVALQQMFNDSVAWGTLGYEKALYLDELSDAAIAVIGEHVPKKSSPLSFCPTFTLTGAYRTRGDTDTALGGSRSAGYVFNVEAAAPNRELYEADRTWARNFWDAMRPHATGSGGYVNFMVEADENRVRASYGEAKYQRLARIKAEYDPATSFTSTPTSSRRRGPPDQALGSWRRWGSARCQASDSYSATNSRVSLWFGSRWIIGRAISCDSLIFTLALR
jgi:hypothetical protein